MWQLAHDTRPFELRRASKKSSWPNATAAGSSAYRFDGSGGSGSSDPSQSDSIASISSALQRPTCTIDAAHATVTIRAIAPGTTARIFAMSSPNETLPRPRIRTPYRSRLKTTLSVPAAEAIRNFNSHQPPMLNFTPSTWYTPPPRDRVTRGFVGRPWPC